MVDKTLKIKKLRVENQPLSLFTCGMNGILSLFFCIKIRNGMAAITVNLSPPINEIGNAEVLFRLSVTREKRFRIRTEIYILAERWFDDEFTCELHTWRELSEEEYKFLNDLMIWQ